MLIEIETFLLADGADEEQFLVADKAVQEGFFHHQSGFVRRTTARSDDGAWCVITFWGAPQYADAAQEAAASDDRVEAFRAVIDPSTLETGRYVDLDG